MILNHTLRNGVLRNGKPSCNGTASFLFVDESKFLIMKYFAVEFLRFSLWSGFVKVGLVGLKCISPFNWFFVGIQHLVTCHLVALRVMECCCSQGGEGYLMEL